MRTGVQCTPFNKNITKCTPCFLDVRLLYALIFPRKLRSKFKIRRFRAERRAPSRHFGWFYLKSRTNSHLANRESRTPLAISAWRSAPGRHYWWNIWYPRCFRGKNHAGKRENFDLFTKTRRMPEVIGDKYMYRIVLEVFFACLSVECGKNNS